MFKMPSSVTLTHLNFEWSAEKHNFLHHSARCDASLVFFPKLQYEQWTKILTYNVQLKLTGAKLVFFSTCSDNDASWPSLLICTTWSSVSVMVIFTAYKICKNIYTHVHMSLRTHTEQPLMPLMPGHITVSLAAYCQYISTCLICTEWVMACTL